MFWGFGLLCSPELGLRYNITMSENITDRDTDVDWELQNALRKKWLEENPDAHKTVGWWSI